MFDNAALDSVVILVVSHVFLLFMLRLDEPTCQSLLAPLPSTLPRLDETEC